MVIARRLISILLLLLAGVQGEPCTDYGCAGQPRYEPFVPAPPGHTPNCAPPGQTFCESLDHYPRQLIKFLVDRCSFDFSTALRDESRNDYDSYSSPPDYSRGYDYPRQDDARLYAQPPAKERPASVYGASFNTTSQQYGYRYFVPSRSHNDPLLSEVSFEYRRNFRRRNDRLQESLNAFRSNEPWSTGRYSRSDQVTSRSHRVNPLLGHAKLKGDRGKRQSNPDAVVLCPTEMQYVAPRAALNHQGNWMYIVNLAERDSKYTQLVRSEKCSNDECNGICSLPAGYSSRCQQQYVQKRLIALEGSGNRLYTDVFWFPHGCSCQIVPDY